MSVAPPMRRAFPVPVNASYSPDAGLDEAAKSAKEIKRLLQELPAGNEELRAKWMSDLEGIATKEPPRTLIAVCGATGAGKSTLLNAILEDKIVPTSGMQACTAVATQIGYHPHPTIEADVYFVSKEDWLAEMQTIIADVKDDAANTTSRMSSEAEASWAKVHAVYPKLTKQEVQRSTPEDVFNSDPRVSALLGRSRLICAPNSKKFGKEIARYITANDAQNSSQPNRPSAESDPLDGISLWPLIRCVEIRCNAKALSTGAVLVDLPGSADANAARNAAGEEYLKQCHYVWIVARITRAVNDRTAHDLLGAAFRTQLKMDGKYADDTIDFIATMTDDVAVSELVNQLGLKPNPAYQNLHRRLKGAWDDMKELKKAQGGAQNNGASSDDDQSSDDEATSGAQRRAGRPNFPLADPAELQRRIDEAQRALNAFCSHKRSEWASQEIVAQFQEGLKEYDGATEERRNPDTFNPDVELRDYSKVGLPVFPCSARDCDRLERRRKSDGKASCFSTVGETGVPALRERCDEIATKLRLRAARNALDQLVVIVASICAVYKRNADGISNADRSTLRAIWEVGDSSRAAEERSLVRRNGDVVHNRPGTLISKLNEFNGQQSESLRDSLLNGLEDLCGAGAIIAANKATSTADALPDRMKWQSYRALLNHHGDWGGVHLNEALVEPMKKHIASPWDQIFRADPLLDMKRSVMDVLKQVFRNFEAAAPRSLKDSVRQQAQVCLNQAEIRLRLATEYGQEKLVAGQRDGSRVLQPHVQVSLGPVYNRAMQELGTGSMARKRAVFYQGLDRNKLAIFGEGANIMLNKLETAISAVDLMFAQTLMALRDEIGLLVSVLFQEDHATADVTRYSTRVARNDVLEKMEALSARAAKVAGALTTSRSTGRPGHSSSRGTATSVTTSAPTQNGQSSSEGGSSSGDVSVVAGMADLRVAPNLAGAIAPARSTSGSAPTPSSGVLPQPLGPSISQQLPPPQVRVGSTSTSAGSSIFGSTPDVPAIATPNTHPWTESSRSNNAFALDRAPAATNTASTFNSPSAPGTLFAGPVDGVPRSTYERTSLPSSSSALFRFGSSSVPGSSIPSAATSQSGFAAYLATVNHASGATQQQGSLFDARLVNGAPASSQTGVPHSFPSASGATTQARHAHSSGMPSPLGTGISQPFIFGSLSTSAQLCSPRAAPSANASTAPRFATEGSSGSSTMSMFNFGESSTNPFETRRNHTTR